MKRLRIYTSHILQTELQGRISDLDLLGKHIHRQTIWLGLRGCFDLQYLNNPLQHVPSSSYVHVASSLEVEYSQTGSSAAKLN